MLAWHLTSLHPAPKGVQGRGIGVGAAAEVESCSVWQLECITIYGVLFYSYWLLHVSAEEDMC
jgi:hypothetical protein